MGSSRALFASAGASVALVAAAAFALLAVSAVFAFGGSSGDLVSSGSRPALILDVSESSKPDLSGRRSPRPATAPVVLRAPARSPLRRERSVRSQRGPVTIAAPEVRAAVQPTVRTPSAVPAASSRAITPSVGTVQPRTGDVVRRVGDDLSSTVQQTSATLARVVRPLGPPVSKAVQDVLDRLAGVLERTTAGVGDTLDKILAPKKK